MKLTWTWAVSKEIGGGIGILLGKNSRIGFWKPGNDRISGDWIGAGFFRKAFATLVNINKRNFFLQTS
jgi:hypothetical protein